MKVCQLTSMHSWDDDRIYQRNCLGLVKEGVSVHYIATGKREIEDGIVHYELKERKGIKRRIVSTWEAFRISLSLKDCIMHFHDPEFLPYVFIYRLLGYKVIFDSHEVYSVRFYQWKSIPNFLRSFIARSYFQFEKLIMSMYHSVIVTSTSMREMYKKHNRNVVAIRNLHSLHVLKKADVQSSPSKWENPIIYTSGMIGIDRNSDKMMEAFALVAKDFPTAKLRYAGWYGPGYKDLLEKKAKRMGITDKVELMGPLPYLEQFKRSSEAAIGFVFLKNSMKNRVASSNRLFEFMYCGLPLLVEKMPECIRIMEDTSAGILVDSNNIEQVADHLKTLLSDKKLCSELGSKGRKAVVEKYHFEQDLTRLIELYNKIKSN